MIGYTRTLFFLTLVLALVFQILAMPDAVASLRPMWVALVIAYWAMFGPNLSVLFAAGLIGLCCDALYDTPLGQHAMALVLLAYVFTRLRTGLGLFPLWQQTLALIPIWGAFALVMFWLDGMARHPSEAALRFLPVIFTTLLWPLVCMVIDGLRGPASRA